VERPDPSGGAAGEHGAPPDGHPHGTTVAQAGVFPGVEVMPRVG
jgi:hypothetical protein